jgi:hypothetical protein
MTRRRTSAGSECKPILSAQLGDILFEQSVDGGVE